MPLRDSPDNFLWQEGCESPLYYTLMYNLLLLSLVWCIKTRYRHELYLKLYSLWYYEYSLFIADFILSCWDSRIFIRCILLYMIYSQINQWWVLVLVSYRDICCSVINILFWLVPNEVSFKDQNLSNNHSCLRVFILAHQLM